MRLLRSINGRPGSDAEEHVESLVCGGAAEP